MKIEEFQKHIELELGKGNIDQAESFLNANIKNLPSASSLYWKGMIALKRRNLNEALFSFEESLKEKMDAQVLSDKGVCLFHLGQLLPALDCMNKAQQMEPNNPYRYSSRAYILERLGKVDKAIEDYEKCIALDPDDAVAHNNLGLLEQKQGRLEKAKQHAKKADGLSVDEEGKLTGLGMEHGNETPSFPPPPPPSLEESIKVDPKDEKKEAFKNERPSLFAVVRGVFTDGKTRKDFFQFWKSKILGTKKGDV